MNKIWIEKLDFLELRIKIIFLCITKILEKPILILFNEF